jgi:hypothetical protein
MAELVVKLQAALEQVHAALPRQANNVESFAIEARRLVAFLMVKAAVKDYDATRLSPTIGVDELWHALLLRPVMYDRVCKILGATEIIDHNPLKANDPEEAKVQRKRAAEYEIAHLGPVVAAWIKTEVDVEEPQPKPKRLKVSVAIAETEITVYVKKLFGRKFIIRNVESTSTVLTLKRAIQHMEGTPPGQMRLYFEGESLCDPRWVLSECGIQDQSELDLLYDTVGC